MKIKEITIDNEIVTQVFISNDEAESDKCKQQIKKLKDEKENIVVFRAGNENINKCLTYMLQFMKNKTQVT